MARRSDLPSTSARIFSRKSSRAARILSAALLGLSLIATLAGLGTAIYLERARDPGVAVAPPPTAEAAITPPADAPIIPTSTAATSDTHDPLAAAAAIPEPPPLGNAESPARQGGTSSPPAAATAPVVVTAPPVAVMPPPVAATAPAVEVTAPAATAPERKTALLEAAPELETPATPAPVPGPAAEIATPAARYWVEYSVYAGTHAGAAARRLQQALAAHGLDSVIAPTHAPDGRALLRVRSSRPVDYGAAKAASAEVRRSLKLSALIHRGSPAAGPAVAQDNAASSRSHGYWVQFGAFPHRPQAERLREQLARSGIETAVSAMRGTSGRTLYRVRSFALPDRGSAAAVVTRAQAAGNSDFLVGQSIAHPAAMVDPDRTDNGPAIHSVPYRAAAALSFPAR